MNDAKLFSIVAGFPELQELTLTQCLSVEAEGDSNSGSGRQERRNSEWSTGYGHDPFNPFDDIYENAPTKWIDQLTDAGIIALTSSCQQLKSLVFDSGGVTDASIAAIAANCMHLSELKIDCVKVTDGALAALVERLPELKIGNPYEGQEQ